MADFAALFDKLEKADAGSRELDLEIWRACTGRPWEWHRSFPKETVITWDQYGPKAAGNPVVTLENLSESIGGAMTLIHPTFYWLMAKGKIKPNEPLYAVQIIDAESGIAVVEVEHNVLEICIIIAALKSRAAVNAEGHEI